jgi:hypothetical protein
MRERAQERAARMRPFIASIGADGLDEVVERLQRRGGHGDLALSSGA